jgi:multiple sugar transport system ATP-binding protein
MGVRPTDFRLAEGAAPGLPRLTVVPDVVEDLGAETMLLFPTDAPRVSLEAVRAAHDAQDDDDATLLGNDRAVFTARIEGRRGPRPGQPIELAIDNARLYFFDPASGASLRA